MVKKDIFLNYLKLGISVIPCGKNKKPIIHEWVGYQQRQATPEEVNQWFKDGDVPGIAMVTGKVSGLCIVDVDCSTNGKDISCIKYNKTLNTLLGLVDKNIKYIVSKTPRGGQHWWFKIPDSLPRNKQNFLDQADFRGEGGYAMLPPSVAWDKDLYDKGIYKEGSYKFDTKFESLAEAINQLDVLPPEIEKLLSTRPITSSTNEDTGQQMSTSYFMEGQRDSDLFRTAMALLDGNAPESLVREVIHRLALSCGFSDIEARVKVQSAVKREERKHLNLAEEVREWVFNTTGYFLTTDIYRSLLITNRTEMQNVSAILRRMAIAGLIDKDPKTNGKWRRKDEEEEVMDIDAELPEAVDVWMPCNLHKICGVNPKNIVMFAGVPSTGKTAWLLNIARHNSDVVYFNSEMDNNELQRRLMAFPGGKDQFRKVRFVQRYDNFADLIRPDGVNIIDYLEIYENHYEIARFIKEIHQKLDRGIAIIAIQKDPKKDFGVGGSSTLHKARIYLNFDQGKEYCTAKIIKGKHWKAGFNPYGAELNYWVTHDGSCIRARSEWLKDGEKIYESGTEHLEWDDSADWMQQ